MWTRRLRKLCRSHVHGYVSRLPAAGDVATADDRAMEPRSDHRNGATRRETIEPPKSPNVRSMERSGSGVRNSEGQPLVGFF